MPFWLSDYKRLECTLLCLSSRLLPTKREKSLTRSNYRENSNLAAPAVRLRKKEGKRKENILGDLRGKPQQGPFSLNSRNSLTKTLKRRLRRNHVRTKQAALSVAASSKLVQPPFAWPRDQGLGPTAGARSLARFASRLSSSWRKRNFFAHLFAP